MCIWTTKNDSLYLYKGVGRKDSSQLSREQIAKVVLSVSRRWLEVVFPWTSENEHKDHNFPSGTIWSMSNLIDIWLHGNAVSGVVDGIWVYIFSYIQSFHLQYFFRNLEEYIPHNLFWVNLGPNLRLTYDYSYFGVCSINYTFYFFPGYKSSWYDIIFKYNVLALFLKNINIMNLKCKIPNLTRLIKLIHLFTHTENQKYRKTHIKIDSIFFNILLLWSPAFL